MKNNQTPIFILSLFDTGILTAKCVYKYNIPVLGFDYNKNQPGFHTKYLKPHFIPHPTNENSELVEYLINASNQFKEKPILIAASDEFVGFVNRNREILGKHFSFLIPEWKVANEFLSKESQLSLVQKWGMKIPKFDLISTKNVDIECTKFNYPVILKPKNFLDKKFFFNKKALIISSNEELITKVKELNLEEVFVQEIINGGGENNYEVNVLYLNDELIFTQTVRKIRQFPDNFGTGCLLETIENKYLEDLTKRFIIENKVYGFSNTEFKYSEPDDNYYFIETNIRPWLQIDLTMRSNNFVKIYYDFLCKNIIDYKINDLIKNEKWVDLINDLQVTYKLYKNGKITLSQWVKSYSRITSFGIFSLYDLKVILKELNYGKKIIKKLKGS